MSDLILVQADGVPKKVVAGTLITFSATTFPSLTLTSIERTANQKIVRAANGHLLFTNFGDASGTTIKIYRYDPQNDKISELSSFAGNNPNRTALFAYSDKLLVVYQHFSGSYRARISDDNGLSWGAEGGLNTHWGSGSISKILRYKGNFYLSASIANGGNVLSFASLNDSLNWTILTGYNANASCTILNDSLYYCHHNKLGNLLSVFRFVSGVSTQVFSTSITGDTGIYQGKLEFFSDPVNDKMYIAMMSTDGNAANNRGWKTTDGTGNTWIADNTFFGLLAQPANQQYSSIQLIYDESFSAPIQGIINRQSSYDVVSWNSSTEKFASTVSAITGSYGSIFPFRQSDAYANISPIALNAPNTRFVLDIQSYRENGATNTIDPKFSLNSGEDWSAMTIDEAKTGIVTILPDVTIGSDTNKFNDNFALDFFNNRDGYELVQDTTNITSNIVSGTLQFIINGNANVRIIRRFIVTGDFRVSVGVSALGAALATASSLKFGLRCYILSDTDGLYFSGLNYVEMQTIKDISNAHIYQSQHIVNNFTNTSSNIVSPNGENPALWIKRTTGAFTTAYGTTETTLNPGPTLSNTGAVMFELFCNDQTGDVKTISFYDLHLYSGTLQFLGGKTSTISWDFGTDGIVSDTGNVLAKIISS